jgi:hypothetical protein
VQLKREEVGCLGAVIVIRQTSSLGTTTQQCQPACSLNEA